VAVDADDDGWSDLFVARDASHNLLLTNQHDGRFKDVALNAEVALSLDGLARAGMGVDAGDVNATAVRILWLPISTRRPECAASACRRAEGV
jgi:hypothetical protein